MPTLNSFKNEKEEKIIRSGRPLKRKNIVFLIPILVLLLICPSPVQTSAETSLADYEEPLATILIPEKLQQEIRQLCEENNLAFELVLAVIQTDNDHNAQMNDIDNINEIIQRLVYYREYWTGQGYCDENVFDLIILSSQRGIEGCNTYIQNNTAYENDAYLQKVTNYKYFLEQIDYNATATRVVY